MRTALIAAIRFYKYLISPMLGNNCRFYPSCSTYAVQALEIHGSINGMYLAIRRILKCHPFHEGGVDPVPENLGKNKNG